jgi:hypothetical protein
LSGLWGGGTGGADTSGLSRRGPALSGAAQQPILGAHRNVPSHGAALGGAEVAFALRPEPLLCRRVKRLRQAPAAAWRALPTRPSVGACSPSNPPVPAIAPGQRRSRKPSPGGRGESQKFPERSYASTGGGRAGWALCVPSGPGGSVVRTPGWTLAPRRAVRTRATDSGLSRPHPGFIFRERWLPVGSVRGPSLCDSGRLAVTMALSWPFPAL